MEPLEFGKFVVQILQALSEHLSFFTVCKKGCGVIKCRWGHPIKWRNKAQVYWKWPIMDTFDKVDMRKRYIQLSAHSFHSSQMKTSIIPYNIIIDVQVEYQVINPLVIYDEYGFKEKEDVLTSYVNNTVQEILSNILIQYGSELDYDTLIKELNNQLKEYQKYPLKEEEIKAFDNPFTERLYSKEVNTDKCISILNIVVTSFDKNISLRTTV
jgi:hypothetical protein